MNSKSKISFLEWSLFIARILLGVIMLAHAYDKWTHLNYNHEGFVQYLKIPAYLVEVSAVLETVSGILLILGLFTEFAAVLIVVLMIGAIFTVRWKLGLIGTGSGGYELNLLLLILAVILGTSGPTKFSIAGIIKNKKQGIDLKL